MRFVLEIGVTCNGTDDFVLCSADKGTNCGLGLCCFSCDKLETEDGKICPDACFVTYSLHKNQDFVYAFGPNELRWKIKERTVG